MLSQDLLSRIINVQWPGGLILVLWVGGFKFANGASAPDPSLDISLDSPLDWLGWDHKALTASDLTEKLRDTGDPVLFDTEPFKREMYALTEETDTDSSTQEFTVNDIIRYGLINQHSGETIGTCFNEFLGYSVPFTFVFGGASPGFQDGDFPTFQAPPADPFLISEAQATDCGLSGVGWKPLEQLILASHQETSSYFTKAWQQNRLIFVNLSKLMGDNPDLETFIIDVRADFPFGNAEQSYGLVANMGIYEKTEQDAELPDDPGGWPLVDDNPIEAGGALDWLNGFQAYFPPNSEAVPLVEREAIDLVEGALVSGEGIRSPGKIRFTITLTGDDPAITADEIFDF